MKGPSTDGTAVALKRHHLVQRRRALGFSQESFAEAVGVDRTTVVRWECAGSEPQPWTRPILARVLKISLDELEALLLDIVEVRHDRQLGPFRKTSPPHETITELREQLAAATTIDGQGQLPRTKPDPGVLTGWFIPATTAPEQHISISGSRAKDTDGRLIDDAVRSLGQLLVHHRLRVTHGPVGVGIEVMTHIADHYRPPGLGAVSGVFGRPNVVRDADLVLIIGGGEGTQVEFDLACSMGKRVLPWPASGGTAKRSYEMMQRHPELRAALSDDDFAALGESSTADEYVRAVERLLVAHSEDKGPE